MRHSECDRPAAAAAAFGERRALSFHNHDGNRRVRPGQCCTVVVDVIRELERQDTPNVTSKKRLSEQSWQAQGKKAPATSDLARHRAKQFQSPLADAPEVKLGGFPLLHVTGQAVTRQTTTICHASALSTFCHSTLLLLLLFLHPQHHCQLLLHLLTIICTARTAVCVVAGGCSEH